MITSGPQHSTARTPLEVATECEGISVSTGHFVSALSIQMHSVITPGEWAAQDDY